MHYIIKGIGGNNSDFLSVNVLTGSSLFDVIKIYVKRRTLNFNLSTKGNTYSSTSCFTVFL